MDFKIMSRSSAIKYVYKTANVFPEKLLAIISINDIYDNPASFPVTKNIFVKHFSFDDVDAGDSAITDAQAIEIYRFAKFAIDVLHVDELIIHCFAGVSRSAGVCAGLLKIFTGSDAQIFDNPQYVPNITCYRKVLNAAMAEGGDGYATT